MSLSCDPATPPAPSPTPPPLTAHAAEAPPEDHHFTVTSGSAVAVSKGGDEVYVADEDHLAVFVVPASFREPAATRVVDLPGPPAQIAASGSLVLVTVRTLPTDDARPAYEALRGPAPTSSTVRRLPSSNAPHAPKTTGLTRRWVEKEYRDLLDSSVEEIPDHELREHSLPRPKSPPPGASGAPTAYPGPKAAPPRKPPSPDPSGHPTSHKPAPKRNTPPVPLDPNLLRKSQGGLLLAFRPDEERGLVEVGRTVIAPDAWGLGVTPDGSRAVVTSAWSARVAVIDLATHKTLFESDVDREPRGVSISADGKTAWISHLTGTDLTRIDDLDKAPHLAKAPLPTGLSRAPVGATLSASLGYSNALSPDGKYLFVPRHALGAEGVGAWWGAPVIDVLDTASGKPTTPRHMAGSPAGFLHDSIAPSADWWVHPGQIPSPENTLLQPRAVVYRKKTDTLLVASEGWDSVAEVDALAADPAMALVRTFDLGDIYDTFGHYPVRGGAPSAIALSADEDTAYIYCSTTFDVVKIDLGTRRTEWLRLAPDALPADASYGRRLFTEARSATLSGGLGCAACHPEGRDDGYVWREGELHIQDVGPGSRFLGLRANAKLRTPWEDRNQERDPLKLYPRQTPLIAGRMRSPGPYGWHAESGSLSDRLVAGLKLHRGGWDSFELDPAAGEDLAKVDEIMDYLRSGLVPPPTPARELTAEEQRGKVVFEGEAQCAACHKPDTEHTDRVAYPLPALPVRFGFDDEDNRAFKTPSLRFVAQTAPFYHDGSAASLEELVANNGNRMGKTLALSPEDKAALVAYLKTL
ncbi:MAG: hypothetical protein U0441_07620 [Polyangiaceae bacterium]